MTKKRFKSKKDLIDFLSTKGIDASQWDESKWKSLNTSPAEIHIQALAESMWNAMNNSTPKQLNAGDWHIPFGDKMSADVMEWFSDIEDRAYWLGKDMTPLFVKVASARCARLSYMTFDGEMDYGKDIKLHDDLLSKHHMSPFEHCARAMSQHEYNTFVKGQLFDYQKIDTIAHPIFPGLFIEKASLGWCNNFRGFVQYRYMIENPF